MSEKPSNLLEDLITSSDDESFVILGSSPPQSVIGYDEDSIISEIMKKSLNLSNNALEGSSTTVNEFTRQVEEYESDIAEVTNSSQHGSIEIASEDILQKLNYLFEENASLKDSLNENNTRMKKQYNELVAWQKEVMDVHQLHRTKFDTLKAYVDTLKAENCKLHRALQMDMLKSFEREESHSSSGEEKLKAKIIDLEEEIEIFKRELEKERKLNRDNVKNYQMTESQLLENESKRLQQENLVNDCNAMFGNISPSHALLQNNLQKCASRHDLESWVTETRNISGNYASEIHEKNQMIDSLKDEIKNLIVSIEAKISEKDTEISDLKDQIRSIEDVKNSISNAMKFKLERLQENCTDKLNEKNVVIEHLEAKLIDLQKNYDAETVKLVKLQENIEELQTNVISLDCQKTAALDQTVVLTHTVTILKEQLSCMESELINSHKDEVAKLTSTIEDLETTVVLLTETTNVYRSDFEVEHGIKEALRSERDQLQTDLNNIQKRNEQLLGQIQTLQGNRSTRPSTASNDPGAPLTYQCPTCYKIFYDFETLEKHVNRCIEIDSLF